MQLPFAVRALGQRLFANVTVRIASGVNQGMRWSVVTSGRGYGSGMFGKQRLQVLDALLQPGDCCWDVGAHKGFVTLAASRMVGPEGTVVAAEPAARNRWFLERHIEWNAIDNVVTVPAALSGERGHAAFGGRGDSLAYALGHGNETVAVRTLPGIAEERALPLPDVLKIDAEGEEAAILEGAGNALRSDAAVLLSVHGRRMHAACTHTLRARGFLIVESREMALCSADPERPWTSDYDLLALGPARAVDEEALRGLPLFTGPEP